MRPINHAGATTSTMGGTRPISSPALRPALDTSRQCRPHANVALSISIEHARAAGNSQRQRSFSLWRHAPMRARLRRSWRRQRQRSRRRTRQPSRRSTISKAVLATVRSKRVVEARVRTPGTVASLKIVEGAHVEPGQVLGLVADPKIALRIKASDAQIVAFESRLATAKAEFERTTELQRKGVRPQARLDQAKTAFDVATNELSAARSERAVIEKQVEEGQVLAPASGRILRVPVTEGSVVMAGESIATIAANDYLLRLEVPERHARFMQKGDTIKVGRRGLGPEQQGGADGRIVQVYPGDPGRPCRRRRRGRRPRRLFRRRARTGLDLGRQAQGDAGAAGPGLQALRPRLRAARRRGGRTTDVVVQLGQAGRADGSARSSSRCFPASDPATSWCAHEQHDPQLGLSGHLDAHVHRLAADAAVPACSAGARACRAVRPAARGGAADLGADGRHPGPRRRAEGRGRGQARHGASGNHRQGDQRRRARLFQHRRRSRAGDGALPRRHALGRRDPSRAREGARQHGSHSRSASPSR